MASLTSAAVTIPSFSGLKASTVSKPTVSMKTSSAPMAFSAKASLKDFGLATATFAASAILASNAMAIEILLGSDDGGLAFVPNKFSVASGEVIKFKNNAGFPHNIIFDEDEIPAGVDATAISMNEEDLLNAPGEEYSVTLKAQGTYKFYCSPHAGAGMVGEVTVN